MKSKGFRQIDNEFFLAILAADLTRAGTKVLLAVIHFTLGYDQRDTADISHSTFEELTGLTRNAVKTAIKELIAYDLISVVSPATNRRGVIYRINKDWRLEGKPTTPPEISDAEIIGPEMSKTTPPDAQNYPSRGVVATPAAVPLKKERKPLKKTNDPSGTGWVALFNKYKRVIAYYRKAYLEHTGKPHPFMKAWRRARVVAKLEAFADDKSLIGYNDWRIMIDYHFRRRIKTDWRIYHFATPGVLENLFYKNLY